MGELVVRGTIAEKPWGMTLAELASRQLTGQVTIVADGKRHALAFDRGAIAAATSPLVADSLARIALTNHFVMSSQVPELQARLSAAPQRDEIELCAEAIGLSLDQAESLRRRVIEQRAARTFAIDAGDYEISERVKLTIVPGISVDVAAVLYRGVRLNLAEQRLAADLRKMGSHFTLRGEPDERLARFGFTELELPVLDSLRAGATLPELEAKHRDVDPRMLAAIVYSLGACGELECLAVSRTTSPEITAPPVARTSTPNVIRTTAPLVAKRPGSDPGAVNVGRVVTKPPRAGTAPVVRDTVHPVVSRTPSPSIPRTQTPIPARGTSPPVSRTPTPQQPLAGRAPTPQKPLAGRAPTPQHPHVVPRGTRNGASPLAGRTPTPQQPLAGRTPTPQQPLAGRTPTPQEPVVSRTTSAPEEAKEAAAEAFARGERALRAEQVHEAVVELSRAAELVPNNVDYGALLAWARFCAASDKQAVAEIVRRGLDRAIHKSDQPQVARFYLGRVERMLGREREALRHFEEVLALQPTHDQAAAEIRVLEARIAANSKR